MAVGDQAPLRTRCAVLGSPIAHSLSPELHRAAYAELGLTDWSYDRFEVDERGLTPFVSGLGGSGPGDPDPAQWRGLSLTKPLKAVALELGQADEQVQLTGAANTLIFEPDGRRQLYNTDIDGLTEALRAAGVTALDRVSVLGAGGTTRAALVSVAALGARRVRVLARRSAQVAELAPLADRLGLVLAAADFAADLEPAELLISTVTAAAAEVKVDQLDRLGPAAAVFDVVYDPWPTPLAAAAVAQGRTVINGLDLLAHQAVGQLQLMTRRTVDAAVLLSAGRKALSARPSA